MRAHPPAGPNHSRLRWVRTLTRVMDAHTIHLIRADRCVQMMRLEVRLLLVTACFILNAGSLRAQTFTYDDPEQQNSYSYEISGAALQYRHRSITRVGTYQAVGSVAVTDLDVNNARVMDGRASYRSMPVG